MGSPWLVPHILPHWSHLIVAELCLLSDVCPCTVPSWSPVVITLFGSLIVDKVENHECHPGFGKCCRAGVALLVAAPWPGGLVQSCCEGGSARVRLALGPP